MSWPWTNRPLSVDSRLLLSFNAVIPLVLIIMVLDMTVFNHAVREFLPAQPETYLWFAFIFNFPHIMASMVTYADRDYMAAYKKPLIRGCILCIVGPLAIAILMGMHFFFIALGFYTIYHLLMQQYGIALMFLKRPPNIFYQFWRWLSVAAGACLYLDVYQPHAALPFTHVGFDTASVILSVLCMPFGLIYFFQSWHKADVTRTSQCYFLATFSIIPAACLAGVLGYPFLLVIIPRFIHDATAFAIYAVHDHNRNLTVTHNVIYRLFKPMHISPVILCIPLAVALSWYFTAHQYKSLPVLAFLVFFMFLHYYMEGYMWRRGMPHRRNIAFRIA